jgi:predicted naringenin-chalcone synthase
MGESPKTALYGVATRPAPYAGSEPSVTRFFREVARATVPEGERERFVRYVERIAASCGIDTRYSVLSDYSAADPSGFSFYPKNWRLDPFPTTADRMRIYERACVGLAEDAARRALASTAIDPSRVTHLIVTSCTGFFAPGPDVLLSERLRLRPDVERTIVGFMGCYAHFAALRLADRIVRANDEAVVLTVAVELCTLHYQTTPTIETLIANSLFGDGAAAAVLAGAGRFDRARGLLAGSLSAVKPDSSEEMSWRIGDHGFVMTLDSKVPESLRVEVPRFFAALLERARTPRPAIAAYAIHPGGRKVVEAIGAALDLGAADVASSLAVLRDFGNMSSATILFVLEAELARLEKSRTSGDVVLLGFGPGLTMEGAVLHR